MNEPKVISRLVEPSASRREIEIEIPAEDVDKEFEKILGDYVIRVKIAGFRKGHAPREMVRKLFDHEILHDVYDEIIPRVLGEELKIRALNPVNVPEIKNLSHEPGQSLRCVAAFEVLPGFDLPDYHAIHVPQRTASVDDAEIQKALEDFQARAAEYIPVEGRGVAGGDYAVAEIQGRDLKTKRNLPVEKAVVLAGHADNEPALNACIIGIKPAEERMFQVSYPKEHANKRVAGKDIAYTLKVSEIKEKKIPELSDEFARSLGDYAGLDDLKAKLRKDIAEAREKSNRSAAASDILKEIAKQIKLELPESVVEQETLSIMKRMLSASRQQPRLSPEAFEELKARAREQAVEHLTNHLILEKVARQEGLAVSEEEIQEEIKTLADANHIAVSVVADTINKEGRKEELQETLLFRKAVDFLAKIAIIN